MKRLLIPLVALLASCGPVITGPVPQTPATHAPARLDDGSALTLQAGSTYQTVTLQNGNVAATASTVRLIGTALRVNDRRCTVDGLDLVCDLGKLEAGAKRVVYATGVRLVQAELTRPDGLVVKLEAK